MRLDLKLERGRNDAERGQNDAERGQSRSHAECISVEGLSCSLFEFYTIRWLMSLRLRRMFAWNLLRK